MQQAQMLDALTWKGSCRTTLHLGHCVDQSLRSFPWYVLWKSLLQKCLAAE